MNNNQNICNICGANYEYYHGRWKCPACGAYKPEELSPEETTLLYNAAQKLRTCDFDEAEKAYDDIVNKYPKNAAGYWGRLLAKYGIKYEETFDGKKTPSCYDTTIGKITLAADYQRAVLYADADTKEYYMAQANYIEAVRKEWLEKAKKEEHYEIFISYKDSDKENGIERTNDSIAAQDLYIHLKEQGYRVFYSRESLRDKTGEKYEPYIFQALSTAKVMIVYGSKPEYITSTWIKNEWKRYGRLMQEGLKTPGSLIVAYEKFPASELPSELSKMQCLDASKKTFYGDLDARIKSILYPQKVINIAPENTPKPKKRKSKLVPILLSLLLIGALSVPAYAYASNHDFWGLLDDITNTTDCHHTEVIDHAVPATCTSTGLTEGKHCSKCNEILTAQQTISKLAHTYNDDNDQICNTCGHDRTDECKHINKEVIHGKISTCTETGLTDGERCKDCGETLKSQDVISMTSHIYDDQYDAICNACGFEREAMCAHSDTERIAGKPATCTETGLTDGAKCSVCGEILVSQQTVPLQEHILTTDEVVEPTCSTVGKTEGSHCLECEKVIVAPADIPMIAHTYDDEYDESCNECGYIRDVECSHSNVTVIPGTNATCVATGLTDGTKCNICGEMIVAQRVIPVVDHTVVIDPAVEPDCTETGLTQGSHCSVCDAILVSQAVVPANGHNAVIDNAVSPTCTQTGLTAGKHCSVCGTVLESQQTVSANGHTVIVDPAADATCTSTGLTEGSHCFVCGAVFETQVVLPMLSHQYDDAYDDICNVCYHNRSVENPLSDWVLASDVPSGAQIVDSKWTYDLMQTMESTESSVSGWERIGYYWSEIGSGSSNYATFPSGYDTGNVYYKTFLKAAYEEYETENTKRVVVNSDRTGYIYWHWMYSTVANAYDRAIWHEAGYGNPQNDFNYKVFGAHLYSGDLPRTSRHETVDDEKCYWYNGSSLWTSNADSQGSYYWYRFEYYTTTYTDYQKIYEYYKMTSYQSSYEVTEGGDICNVQKYVRYRMAE